MRRFDPESILKPRAGYHYEPRVFWGRKTIEKVDDDSPAIVTQDFNQGDFYNAEPYPILFTKMIVMSRPLEWSTPPMQTTTANRAGAPQSVRARVQKRGARPFSFAFGMDGPAWEGNTTPGSFALRRTPFPFSDQQLVNTGYDVAAWDFELPVRVAAAGLFQFDLAPPPPVRATVGGEAAIGGVRALTMFREDADGPQQTPGSTRANLVTMQSTSKALYAQLNSQMAADTMQAVVAAEAVDPFAGPVATTLWSQGYGITPRQFSAQQSAANRASSVNGFTIALSRNYLGGEKGGVGNTLLFPLGEGLASASQHLAHSVFTRAKTTSGGTGAWWWRERAPLAIVSPTITPSPVYRFKQPFVLDHGEELQVELDIGELFPTTTTSVEEGQYRSHSAYISFVGYACIKD